MIAAVLALACIAAQPDSAAARFHVSLFTGLAGIRFVKPELWEEFALQAEIDRWAFLRFQAGFPLIFFEADQKGAMSDGTTMPEPIREMGTVCLGKEWRKGGFWAAIAGGWTWGEFDTVATYDDPRRVLVEDVDGLHSATTTGSGIFGPIVSEDQVHWLWLEKTARQSPYLMAELGAGWPRFGFGCRVERRFSNNLGCFLRARLP